MAYIHVLQVWAINVTGLYARIGTLATRTWGPGLPAVTDVGNIILGAPHSQQTAARKLWSLAELKQQDTFWYDWAVGGKLAPHDLLYFCSPRGNPATVHNGSLQLALMTITHAVVANKNVSHAVYEDLEIKYGGGDGMYGISTSDLTVRNCDISWIGGGCLGQGTWPAPISPLECVRFGNGIEFPDFTDAHKHLTENIEIYGNTISEIYDAALSPQGAGWYLQRNISFRE